MLGRTRDRILSAADLLRPKTFFRTLARVDALVDATRELTSSVEALRIQTEQLMTIQRLDWERRDEVSRPDKALDAGRIDAHVTAAIDGATIELDPFPHIVVNDWLPADAYKRIIDAIPPAVFFADRDQTRADQSKQRMMVPFSLAPAYSRVVWNFVADTIVGDILNRVLNTKFQKVLCEYVRSFCPALPGDVDLTMHPSDGRIMLRRPGYNLTPHRDPKWGFATGLVYLARPGDNEVHGTRLYRVREDGEAPSGKVYYVEQDRCELVKTVPFRPNTFLAFLNSSGAHSASIPPDAQPANLERYLYQFRLGPTATTIRRLLQSMPPDKAALWAGDKSDRAAGY